MNKKLGIGLVGLGEHMVRSHVVPIINYCGPEEIIRCYCDPRDDAHTALPPEVAGKVKRVSFDEMLSDKSVDAVIIASPDKFHAEQLEAVIVAGKHAFCEKPMALTSTDLEKLKLSLRLARQKNLIVSSCHPRRYDPPVLWLKDQIDSGKLGELTSFYFFFNYHEVTDEWKKDRSLLADHFGHEIDLFRFLFPRETEQGFAAHRSDDGFDHYKASVELFRSDTPWVMFMGERRLKEKEYHEHIEVCGYNGGIRLQVKNGTLEYIGSMPGPVPEVPASSYQIMFRDVTRNFIDAIEKLEPNYLTPHDLLINNGSIVSLLETGHYLFDPLA